MTHDIWRQLQKERLGEMSLTRRGPDNEPELSHFAQKLRGNIAKGVRTGELDVSKWQVVLDVLDHLLGIPEQNHVWRYLNKGVHDVQDLEESGAAVVSRVVEELKKMDDVLNPPPAGRVEAAA